MSIMSRAQRAMQLWSVLSLAARNQQLLSYKMVQNLTGLPEYAQAETLGVVAAYCIVHKLPHLTVLVVNEPTGLPGEKFPGPGDIFAQQARVFVYDWFAHGIPTPDDFEAASERLREAKVSA